MGTLLDVRSGIEPLFLSIAAVDSTAAACSDDEDVVVITDGKVKALSTIDVNSPSLYPKFDNIIMICLWKTTIGMKQTTIKPKKAICLFMVTHVVVKHWITTPYANLCYRLSQSMNRCFISDIQLGKSVPLWRLETMECPWVVRNPFGHCHHICLQPFAIAPDHALHLLHISRKDLTD